MIHTSLFLYIYCNFFIEKGEFLDIITTLDTESSLCLSIARLIAVCLVICLVAWKYYFSEVYFSHTVKLLSSFLRACIFGPVHGKPEMKLVSAEII